MEPPREVLLSEGASYEHKWLKELKTAVVNPASDNFVDTSSLSTSYEAEMRKFVRISSALASCQYTSCFDSVGNGDLSTCHLLL